MDAYHLGETCGYTCGYCDHCCSNLLRSVENGDVFLECKRCGGFQPPPDTFRNEPIGPSRERESVEQDRVASS